MKKTIILGFLMTALVWSAYAQENTHYGIGTVSIGSGNSSFGWYSGTDCNASSFGNSFFGQFSGRYTTSGIQNSYFGALCGSANETGNQNTAMGFRALTFNRTGSLNVAVGYSALDYNYGDENTALGAAAMSKNIHGYYNTAVGSGALYYNESSRNTATGRQSLYNNTTGHSNIANGYHSLQANTTGYYNVAIGAQAMYLNVDGVASTATGYFALANNTSGPYNSASGFRALQYNTTGANNTAHGSKALYFITTGSNNTALGSNAGPSLPDLTNTTAVGYLAIPTASNQVRIGNAAVTSIGGQVSWSTFSDGRFKKDIKEDVSGLAFIKQLRPVSYVVDKTAVNKFLHIADSSNAQTETRGTSLRQTGFVAQEVEAVVKKTGYVFYGVDVPKNENDHYSIRYAEFVVPLVKAVQELTAKLDAQNKEIETLKKQIGVDKGNSVLEDAAKGQGAMLHQNIPNPFSTETEIAVSLPDDVSNANLIFYTIDGKQLKVLPLSSRGDFSVKVQVTELGNSNGICMYALMADGKIIDSKRLLVTGK